MSNRKSMRITLVLCFSLGLFTFAIGLGPAAAEAQGVGSQSVENQLASVGLDDFVIKPGQALPTGGFNQPSPQQQPLQPLNQGQPVPQPSIQSTLLPPAGEPQVMGVGLTRAQTGENAHSGGSPEWQILQNPNGPHTAILFNPNLQVIAVYQIDSASGAITLKSVRNVSWDLQIEDYNSNKPAPKDIRAMQP